MIRVLKGADFSACGLGQIDIPVEDTTEAKAIVNKFSGLSTEKATKLKNFINKMANNNIYSKLHYLMLPMFANNVSDALQNVLTNNAKPTSSVAQISTNGISFNINQIVNLTSHIKGTLATQASSFGGILIPNSEKVAVSENVMALQDKTSAPAYCNKIYIDGVNAMGATFADKTSINSAMPKVGTKSVGAYSESATTDKFLYINNGVVANKTGVSAMIETNNNSGLILNSAAATSISQSRAQYTGEISVLYVADYLDETELKIMYDALVALA